MPLVGEKSSDVALLSSVLQVTVTCSSPAPPVTDTVYTASSPSFTDAGPSMVAVNASSVIVAVAVSFPSDTPAGPVIDCNVNVNISDASVTLSS